ncbi:glutathione S-transferase C-terminal domain-containing protein [Tessaracoccus oleiagri]|uniref:Putative glutathione S-transferase n=1 Tax=Tessaracoccus oleiagri TaxID=686624 RepID=A0A1G9N2I3_9ACTN|nr:glutathione S-transferase C-terminal domain-containing protein [Tessaracoccus oleiagri]SDL80720.1 putative glutathione S-transferase [Tessaracoccus oleiagri]
MSNLSSDLEADVLSRPACVETGKIPETQAEQTPDGGFRRQRNHFTRRFGDAPGQAEPELGRYLLLGSTACGWNRRQQIVLRLLGLSEAVPFVLLTGRDEKGWRIAPSGNDLADRFGTDLLNDFYRRTDPDFVGRGTSPTVLDAETGLVVTNNYHLMSIDWETAWKPFHADGAPDLYPEELRPEIDLLNQQLFDDVNNGTYKVLFATSEGAARAAKTIFEARLADYDFRLASRRYLFGDRLTDSDVRLFITLSSYERGYRPGIAKIFGEEHTKRVQDYPNLWAYARDLFAQGFVDDRELYFLGLIPGPSGTYIDGSLVVNDPDLPPPAESLAAWQEPAGRKHLTGSPLYTGPGGGGSHELWRFG